MWLITGMFVIGGAAVLAMGIYYMYLGQQTHSWMPVTANIVNKGTIMSRGAGGDVQTHKYVVMYEYEVAGKKYLSTRKSFRPALIPTYKDRARFDGVTSLTVYYCPQNPALAVIDRGVDLSNFLAIPAAIFFIGVGVANAVWG